MPIIKMVATMVVRAGTMMISIIMTIRDMETICSTRRSNGKAQIEPAIKMMNNIT